MKRTTKSWIEDIGIVIWSSIVVGAIVAWDYMTPWIIISVVLSALIVGLIIHAVMRPKYHEYERDEATEEPED